MEQISMFDTKEKEGARLRIYLRHEGKSRNEIHIGDFMKWMSVNLDKFKRANKIGKYEALDSEQSASFTEFLRRSGKIEY